ncbi:phosphoadenosine phosphosulfate reductase family protein [Vibrio phage 1.214.O._10N.222.54.F11]|nr:phosphoadenosine phosphosulfate reductase family protein [Vibrio phage 1.013.O._10N.286.54.F9]AUR95890.1 phosphoadenosine phosphosulfate reductase family protein [Vibrio phage 1.214.O._10N.222.54.F11]
MKKVVSFSGGRTSAYLCYLMKEKFGDEVDFIYMDTGAEHEKTYEFIRKVNDEFGLNLTCLRTDFSSPLGVGNGFTVVGINSIAPDLNPFREMVKKYGVPYIGGMFCTDRMKLVPFTKYCQEKYGRGNYETWLGIRADEPKRLNPKKGIRYLAEISDFEKSDIIDYWSKMPFDLDIPEHLGNCVFCPKKSKLKLAAAQRDEPEQYHDFLEMLYSDDVRHDDKSGHWSQMYRGKQSLEQVVAMFDGSTGNEIKSRIRGSKMTDTGSCSESCEVFVCETNQISMF